MKLSIVIICWNDLKVVPACLASIYEQTRKTEFEVIVSDNGSTDASLEFIQANYPQVRIVENKANLGYARGNNAGIAAVGEADYVLILNPDTIIHEGALDKWAEFADRHPEAGAFGWPGSLLALDVACCRPMPVSALSVLSLREIPAACTVPEAAWICSLCSAEDWLGTHKDA